MQYRAGSVTVTNASATVTFAEALVGAETVAIGDLFKLDRDGDAVYQLASRTPSSGASITSATLSAPYGGTSGAGLSYQIVSDFTVNRGYPRPNQGDADSGDWLAAALDAIDADIASILGTGSPTAIADGSVIYKTTTGYAGNFPQLVWDVPNLRLGVGTALPAQKLTVAVGVAADGIRVEGLTGGRPTLSVYDGAVTLQLDSVSGVPRLYTDGVTMNFYESGIWRMRLDAGRLVIGTFAMDATGGNAGDVILLNAKRYRGLNAAGNSAKALIGMNASDQVEIASDGQQVRIGTVASGIGDGAVATLGLVGGTLRPISSAQAGWEPYIGSTGAQRYRPFWE